MFGAIEHFFPINDMNNEKADTAKNGLKSYIPILVAIVVTFGGTVGGNYLLVRDVIPEVVRADPFYGVQGRSLDDRLTEVEKEERELKSKVNSLPPRELTERVLRLELLIEELRKDVDKLK